MQSTLVGMFMSGGSCILAPTPGGRASIGTSSAALQSTTPDYAADLNIEDDGMEYFPDPPCIAPMADQEDKGDVKALKGVSPQTYCMRLMNWKSDDVEVTWARAANMAFVELYKKSHGISDSDDFPHKVIRLTTGKATCPSSHSTRTLGELVLWGFVNITQQALGIRSVSSLDEDKKTGEVIKPGQCVLIDKIVEQEGIRFLKMVDGRGWVFDGNGKDTIMAKLEEVETGSSWYRVVGTNAVGIRKTPVHDDAAKTNKLLAPKELVVGNIKARVRGQTWVHLADGSGWVFVMLPGTKKDKSLADTVLQECDAEITMGAAYQDMFTLPPTTDVVEVGDWTYIVGTDAVLAIGSKAIGTFIQPGDVIKVDKRAYQDGSVSHASEKGASDSVADSKRPSTIGDDAAVKRRWLRLADGRGWLPDKSLTGKDLVVLRTETFVSYPSHFKGVKNIDKPSAAWMVGLV